MDYNKVIGDISLDLSKQVLQAIVDSKDSILVNQYTVTELSKEEKEKVEQASEDLFNKVYSIIAQSEMPIDYVGAPLEQLAAIVQHIQVKMKRVVEGISDEMLSRYVGHKNESGKFNVATAPVNKVLAKLNDIRKETGEKEEDYI